MRANPFGALIVGLALAGAGGLAFGAAPATRPARTAAPGATTFYVDFHAQPATRWGTEGFAVPAQPASTMDPAPIVATVRALFAPFNVVVVTDPPAVPCRTIRLAGAFAPFDVGEGGCTLSSSAAGYVFPDRLNGSPNLVGLVVAHELGHLCGLWDAMVLQPDGRWTYDETGLVMGMAWAGAQPPRWRDTDWNTLAAAMGLAGDLNHDGRVDLQDYTLAARSGDVAAYVAVVRNFGNTAPR